MRGPSCLSVAAGHTGSTAQTGSQARRRTAMAESYSGEAYCVKCKEKRQFTGNVEETNGRRFAKGVCPVCGTKVTRILGKA